MKLVAKNLDYQMALDTHKNIKEISRDGNGPMYYECVDCNIQLYCAIEFKTITMSNISHELIKDKKSTVILSCNEYKMVNILL